MLKYKQKLNFFWKFCWEVVYGYEQNIVFVYVIFGVIIFGVIFVKGIRIKICEVKFDICEGGCDWILYYINF